MTRPIEPGSREHRRRACERKRRYPDQIAALVFAVHQMETHRGLKLDTYKCRFCHGWHLCRTEGNLQRVRARLFRARPKGVA